MGFSEEVLLTIGRIEGKVDNLIEDGKECTTQNLNQNDKIGRIEKQVFNGLSSDMKTIKVKIEAVDDYLIAEKARQEERAKKYGTERKEPTMTDVIKKNMKSMTLKEKLFYGFVILSFIVGPQNAMLAWDYVMKFWK